MKPSQNTSHTAQTGHAQWSGRAGGSSHTAITEPTPDLELYNLETDPGEFVNLVNDGTHSAVQQRLTNRVLDIWGDADALDRRIRNSQRSRLMIRDVLGNDATF